MRTPTAGGAPRLRKPIVQFWGDALILLGTVFAALQPTTASHLAQTLPRPAL
ncbi:MAG: hypothetical protein AAFQ58_16440 [Pseudomonadota bacterium]